MTTLETVELRDEAVRILHRALSHVQAYEYRKALGELESDRAREWYDDIQSLSGLGCVFQSRKRSS